MTQLSARSYWRCGKQHHLSHDGGEEDPVDLDGQDEGEVQEQGGGVPQQHLEEVLWQIIERVASVQPADDNQRFCYRNVSFPKKESPIIFILPQSRHLKTNFEFFIPQTSTLRSYLTPVSNKWFERHYLHVDSKHVEEW